MDSPSPQVVSAARLPILNPNEFDLWKIRIEQYFLMTDYSLREVILNGDSLVPTRIVKGVVQPVAPTTAEHKLARKNELKARGNGYNKKGTKSKQNRTKLSTKRKVWKIQQSKVNKKSNPTKSKPREIKKSKKPKKRD
nr:hypothetical protein [Tanacetum cinerariifolium]